MIHGVYVEVYPIIQKFLAKNVHIFMFIGGRGIGKTYSALDLCRMVGENEVMFSNTEDTNKFLYLRRTGVEVSAIASPEANVFKRYNYAEGYNIVSEYSPTLGFGTFKMEEKAEEIIGYSAALSTFANLRGVDFSDVSFILYDEFIPESKNKRPLKNEGRLFLNMLETVNRNRALEGRPEIVVCMLCNAIDLGAPILSELKITPILNNMIFRKQQKYTDYGRSLHIERYIDHKVSEMKRDSMLYKFASTTDFVESSLSGEFIDNDMTSIVKENLNEFSALLSVENVCVYKHKSKEMYHISQVVGEAKYKFRVIDAEKVKKEFYHLYKRLVIEHAVTYDSYATKVVFEEMIHYKPFTYN